MSYESFLEKKRVVVKSVGFEPGSEINPMLFPFQRAIVSWALRRGRAAIFADCGLGKSPMQLEWARHVCAYSGRPVLILAPLAVAQQTAREGAKFGIEVTVCESDTDVRDGVNITNYEKLHRFTPDRFGGIVLDESSILKAFDGKTRKQITDFVESILFRLACTATPAPNDLIELTNHAEFLDVMTGKEIIALYFTQDGNTTHQWRLKGHARNDFWRWMAEWTVAVRKPSDLGYPDDGFILPPLNMHQSVVAQREALEGQLFAMEAQTLQERRGARRATLGDRVAKCAELVNASDESWIVWCDLNGESQALAKAIPGSVEVTGSDSAEHKEKAMMGFSRGEFRVLVS
ncbi:MAG: DNA methylase, partial [Schleiferiaceae bacterium]